MLVRKTLLLTSLLAVISLAGCSGDVEEVEAGNRSLAPAEQLEIWERELESVEVEDGEISNSH